MIRPMTDADLPAVVLIENEVFPESPWSAGAWAEELAAQSADRRYFVADDGSVRGYAGVLRGGSDADLTTIAVRRAEHGRGLGRALLSAVLEICREWSVQSLFLEVAPDNIAARSLYTTMGFVDVGERRHYYGRDRHAVTMQLRIRQPRGAVLLEDRDV